MFIDHFELGILLGFTSLFLGLIYHSFFTIEEGHMGIITYFGKANIDSEKNLKLYFSGAHFKWPWGKTYQLSTMEQVFDLNEDDGKMALAHDGTILRLEAKLRYRINTENIYDYFFKLKAPVEHIKGLFSSLLTYQIASFKGDEKNTVISSYASIRKERKLLNDQLDRFCHDNLHGRYGIELKAIDLIDILPPVELDQALNAVLSADIEAQTLYYRAEASCIQKKLAAKAGVEIEKSKAEAAGIEILTLGKYLLELNKEKTLSLYLERRKKEVLFDTKNIFIRGSV